MDEFGGYGQLSNFLSAGEYIVWKGQPVGGHIFSKNDLYMIPFSLMWSGFAIFWEMSAIASGAPFFFQLWGIPFVLVGLYMIGGRFFIQQFWRRRTYYAITNQRILCLRGGKISSLNRGGVLQMNMFLNRDGSGTIAFGDVRSDRYYGYWWSYRGLPRQGMNGFVLENIPDVNQVYRMLSVRQ